MRIEIEKLCKHCKTKFLTTNKQKLYCSNNCLIMYWKTDNTSYLRTLKYTKIAQDEKSEIKLKLILKQNKTCPGCGHKFDFDDTYALLQIFHRCHIHSHKCEKYSKEENRLIFYACSKCNRKQTKICGYWTKPFHLQTLCSKDMYIRIFPNELEFIDNLI